MLSAVRIAGRTPALYSASSLVRCQFRNYADDVKTTEAQPDSTVVVQEPQDWSKASNVVAINGVPEEHVKRTCQIYVPAKTSMSSGTFSSRKWRLNFTARERWENPTMGWASSADPLSNLEMDFPTKEDAIAFAEKMGWTPEVTEPNIKTFKKKSYGANFAWDKRTRVATK